MSEKIDEYWHLIAENSLILIILDPRYKLDIIDTKNLPVNKRLNDYRLFG
jgi:hypothetical protein